MTHDTIAVIKEIIENRKLEHLIGLKEELCFDAKTKDAYGLETPDGRYELAEDVSSFANAKGGFIIVGLITERIIEQKTEKVTELDLITEHKFLVDQYKEIVKEYVYPKIKGLCINWIEDKNKKGYGVGCIVIPPQDQNDKFFLIKNVLENSEKIKQIVFGIAQRTDSSSMPLPIDQLHQKVKYGMSPHSERLTRIEEKIDLLLEHAPGILKGVPAKALEERIRQIISEE